MNSTLKIPDLLLTKQKFGIPVSNYVIMAMYLELERDEELKKWNSRIVQRLLKD